MFNTVASHSAECLSRVSKLRINKASDDGRSHGIILYNILDTDCQNDPSKKNPQLSSPPEDGGNFFLQSYFSFYKVTFRFTKLLFVLQSDFLFYKVTFRFTKLLFVLQSDFLFYKVTFCFTK